jgi:hypothetical protein
MSYTLDVEYKGEYLHVIVRGENTLTNILSYFDEVYGACLLYHCANVLIEEHLSGPCLDTFDIFVVITKNYSRAKTINLRLAFVDMNAHHNEQGLKFGENLAHIRGVDVRLFNTHNVELMVAWLLKKDTKAV